MEVPLWLIWIRHEVKVTMPLRSILLMFPRKSCHVCQAVHPKIEELAADDKYKGKFGFYEVDVEEERNLFARFSLKGVPQVLFFNDGEYVGKMAGEKDIEEYEDKIDSIIG